MDFFKGFELQNGVMKAGVPGQRALRARFGKAQSSPVTAGFLAIFLGTTAMLPLCLEPKQALSQEAQLVKVDVTVLAKGYRVSKLIGSAVTNDKNEKIGSIDDMIVDHKNILFAVLQVGGIPRPRCPFGCRSLRQPGPRRDWQEGSVAGRNQGAAEGSFRVQIPGLTERTRSNKRAAPSSLEWHEKARRTVVLGLGSRSKSVIGCGARCAKRENEKRRWRRRFRVTPR